MKLKNSVELGKDAMASSWFGVKLLVHVIAVALGLISRVLYWKWEKFHKV